VPRNPIPILITLAGLVAVGAAYWVFQTTELPRYRGANQVLVSRSELKLWMTVRHTTGKIAEEDYAMSDIDGLSRSRYRAVGRDGLSITIDEKPTETVQEGPNVAYFFQEVVQDGIWDLQSKPPRGDRTTTYRVDIYQRTGDQAGSRSVRFTDPHYWATTGGHQFHLTLAKDKPLPNLLTMTSTTLTEPRYEKIVEDFREFGPQSFRDKVAAAQERLGAGEHAAPGIKLHG
jgi:hypothetical protein